MMDQKRELPEMEAKIDRILDKENSKVKAIASVNINGAFAVHGIRIIESEKGYFIQMPQKSYEKGGKKHYSDIFHPVTAECRTAMQNEVLAAYDEKLSEGQEMGGSLSRDSGGFRQSM